MPPSDTFWFVGLALAEIGYEYDPEAGLFIHQLGGSAVELPDDARMTREQAIVSLAHQGVDMQSLLLAMMRLDEGSEGSSRP